jgi:hypothetical protein
MKNIYTYLLIVGILFFSCEKNNQELNSVQRGFINQINNAKYTNRFFDVTDSINLILPQYLYLDANPIVKQGVSNFIIFNTESKNILIFSKAGIFIKSFGRNGDGPGEFRSIGTGSLDDDGNIYIYDYVLRRISIFDKLGNLSTIFNLKNFDAQVRQMYVDKFKKIYLHHTPSPNFQGFVSIFDSTGYIKTIIDQINGYRGYYERGFLEGGIVLDYRNNIYEANIYTHNITKVSAKGNISEFGVKPVNFIELPKANIIESMKNLSNNYRNSTIIRNLFLIDNSRLLLLETLKFNEFDPIDVQRKFIVYDTSGTYLGELYISSLQNFISSNGNELVQLWNPPPMKFETEEYNYPTIKTYGLITDE